MLNSNEKTSLKKEIFLLIVGAAIMLSGIVVQTFLQYWIDTKNTLMQEKIGLARDCQTLLKSSMSLIGEMDEAQMRVDDLYDETLITPKHLDDITNELRRLTRKMANWQAEMNGHLIMIGAIYGRKIPLPPLNMMLEWPEPPEISVEIPQKGVAVRSAQDKMREPVRLIRKNLSSGKQAIARSADLAQEVCMSLAADIK